MHPNMKILNDSWTENSESKETAQKIKFSINDFFSKCDQIRR